MFTDFIKQILGAERNSVSNRLENEAVPSVIAKKTALRNIGKTLPPLKEYTVVFILKADSLST